VPEPVEVDDHWPSGWPAAAGNGQGEDILQDGEIDEPRPTVRFAWPDNDHLPVA